MSVLDQSQGGLESAFYRELLFELGEHAQRGGTAYGAAVVAKKCRSAFGVDGAAHLPLPRPTGLSGKRPCPVSTVASPGRAWGVRRGGSRTAGM